MWHELQSPGWQTHDFFHIPSNLRKRILSAFKRGPIMSQHLILPQSVHQGTDAKRTLHGISAALAVSHINALSVTCEWEWIDLWLKNRQDKEKKNSIFNIIHMGEQMKENRLFKRVKLFFSLLLKSAQICVCTVQFLVKRLSLCFEWNINSYVRMSAKDSNTDDYMRQKKVVI